jgi:uncharacterized phage protein (TIGR01671 family)
MIENKELEFRAWDIKRKLMLPVLRYGLWVLVTPPDDDDEGNKSYELQSKLYEDGSGEVECITMQYVRLKDKNQQKIYDGDFIRYKHINRRREEFPGPLGGVGYLEPFIDEEILLVDNFGTLEFSLFYVALEYDREIVLDEWGMSIDKWLGPEGDLQYLLDEYNFKDEEELLKHLGCEVIGNCFENPELIEEIDESN